MRGKNLEDNFC